MKILEKNVAIELEIRVIPRASKSEVVGEHDGALKVRISSPPVDGAANAELIKLLSKFFGVAKADIDLMSGQTSKTKRIRIANVSRSRFNELVE
ncbi:DUF167 family protein YggU [soil metagenome]